MIGALLVLAMSIAGIMRQISAMLVWGWAANNGKSEIVKYSLAYVKVYQRRHKY